MAQDPVLKFKDFQFYWNENVNLDLPELPESAVLEIYPTFIIVDANDGWRVVIPMDNIRFMSVTNPVP